MPTIKKLLKKKRANLAAPRAITRFRPVVLTRHPSHFPLREQLPLLPFRTVIRLGSTTPRPDDVTHGGRRIECNTVESVKNSADKLRMKNCFKEADVSTAQWAHMSDVHIVRPEGWILTEGNILFKWPIVAKHRMGSRGRGNTLIKSEAEYQTWRQGKTLENYIIEVFHDYNREYRLHMTKEHCFYTCRKVMKTSTPEHEKWHRHEDNCVWLVDSNAKFDRPTNWDAIVADCKKALDKLGLDVCSFDVKIQTARNSAGVVRPNPKFILLECNSASSFGEGTLSKYLVELPKILKAKHG